MTKQNYFYCKHCNDTTLHIEATASEYSASRNEPIHDRVAMKYIDVIGVTKALGALTGLKARWPER